MSQQQHDQDINQTTRGSASLKSTTNPCRGLNQNPFLGLTQSPCRGLKLGMQQIRNPRQGLDLTNLDIF